MVSTGFRLFIFILLTDFRIATPARQLKLSHRPPLSFVMPNYFVELPRSVENQFPYFPPVIIRKAIYTNEFSFRLLSTTQPHITFTQWYGFTKITIPIVNAFFKSSLPGHPFKGWQVPAIIAQPFQLAVTGTHCSQALLITRMIFVFILFCLQNPPRHQRDIFHPGRTNSLNFCLSILAMHPLNVSASEAKL